MGCHHSLTPALLLLFMGRLHVHVHVHGSRAAAVNTWHCATMNFWEDAPILMRALNKLEEGIATNSQLLRATSMAGKCRDAPHCPPLHYHCNAAALMMSVVSFH